VGVLAGPVGKTEVLRFVASGLVVAMVTGLIALSAAPASAEEQLCGTRIQNNEITADIPGLQRFLQQGEQNNINALKRLLPWGDSGRWCGPLEFASDIGVELIVGGALMHLVRVEIPFREDFLAAVGSVTWERVKDKVLPPRLPDVGPGDSTVVLAPVAWTGGIGLNLRPGPGRAGWIGNVPEGNDVSILCTTRGELVYGPFGPTDLWDRVAYNGQIGYVSDAFLWTGTNEPVAPSC
jgi:hypothetical protein